jgi:hypothetical protein
MRAAWYMRHSTSLLGFAVENLPPPPLPLSLSMSYLPHNQAQRDGGMQRRGEVLTGRGPAASPRGRSSTPRRSSACYGRITHSTQRANTRTTPAGYLAATLCQHVGQVVLPGPGNFAGVIYLPLHVALRLARAEFSRRVLLLHRIILAGPRCLRGAVDHPLYVALRLRRAARSRHKTLHCHFNGTLLLPLT